MKMKNKKVPEEIMIDYVAKARTERTCENPVLKKFLAWLTVITYAAYTLYSITELNEKQTAVESFFILLLMMFFLIAVPPGLIYVFLLQGNTENEIEAARKFLLESGQQASRENINILMNRYYKGDWQKIEDMLYENRKVFSAENIELVSGNMNDENLKVALPAK